MLRSSRSEPEPDVNLCLIDDRRYSHFMQMEHPYEIASLIGPWINRFLPSSKTQ
ncbi:hypothetical protein H696_05264 [Fonticula alba]|uniref:Uncharacterized protein n=1 Tax=Fonticula alba TaxID=691883 RepID=A0A058Z497_FONAL|nr:hypothetical protein H696_05264 [Fonticula alba]KCV68347.1 hypothetical protein H696_05264 [Fonticula alba]|eukprot:XP_009497401.1 hypothetical protein H696_05264 [Fonticula alba]